LNYKSSLSDFQVRTENNHLRFAFQKEREVTLLPVTPSRILFTLFTIDHSPWLTPGFPACRQAGNPVPPLHRRTLYR